MCYTSGFENRIASGDTGQFVIVSRDRYGNNRTTGDDRYGFEVQLRLEF
jgi:hypothetical protein